jgi:hypothetical protein
MGEISPQEATTRARAQAAVELSVPARSWHVRRLDRPGESYYLVVFGADGAVAVAAVSADKGEILTWASLPGQTTHQVIEAQDAAKLAGITQDAKAELVWQPCRATRSLLYPLWEIRTSANTVYVDQQGKVWANLAPSGPGG